MKISKKLSIAQLFLSFSHIFLYIYLIYKLDTLDPFQLYSSSSVTFPIAMIIITGIVIFVIGIVQIIYKFQEKSSGLYLAAGICALLIILSIFVFVIMILNIIAILVS